MNFIIANRWIILIILEILAWSSTFFMLYARYRLRSDLLFKIGTILTIITGVIPQTILGIINFIYLKKLDLFTIIILLLILYGFTFGRKKIKQLDAWAKKKFV